jgi:hypothetical protein
MKENNLTKQRLAQKRNYFKFALTGMIKTIDLEVLTGPEKFAWNQIINHRKILLDEFDKHSKEMGLNIPEHRCWCGKPAKLEVDYYGCGEYEWVCNKHKEL